MVLRIGTRGSALALAQARQVVAALTARLPGTEAELVVITTRGDDGVIAQAAGGVAGGPPPSEKGLFVKELEAALLEGRIDLAVHSVKDLPTDLPPGLVLGAVLAREDPRDAVVTPRRAGDSVGGGVAPVDGLRRDALRDLPAAARIGAGSLRRQAQLKRLRRDVEVIPIRGNVDTRLRRMDEGQYEAVVVAACGLHRLGLTARVAQWLDPRQMLPAPGQGAVGVERRADRTDVQQVCAALDDPATHQAIRAERALLRGLGGGCQVPIAALATGDGQGGLTLEGAVFSPEGLRMIRQTISGPAAEAERLGIALASHLRARGADRLLFGQPPSGGQRLPSVETGPRPAGQRLPPGAPATTPDAGAGA